MGRSAAVGFLLLGCAGVACTTDQGAETLPSAEAGVVMAIASEHVDRPGEGAFLTGHLRDHDGCLVIEHVPGEFYLPVFAEGGKPRWADGSVVFDGVDKPLDGYAALRGREMTLDEGDDVTVPSACPMDLARWSVHEMGP